MFLTLTYVLYLGISAALTMWVARTLHHRGRLFLVDAFQGDERLADSVNDLLVVGFYLINFGYVTLVLKYGSKPTELAEAIEFLSTKVGLVLMILGVMHFVNLIVFSRLRSRGRKRLYPSPSSEGRSPFAETNFASLKDTISTRAMP